MDGIDRKLSFLGVYPIVSSCGMRKSALTKCTVAMLSLGWVAEPLCHVD